MKLTTHWAKYLNYCLISLFIIAYFTATSLWLWFNAPEGLCPSGPYMPSLKASLTNITNITGLEQSWNFFSPNISTTNSYTLITTTLKNGLIKLIELPRMEKLSRFDKLQRERYRKLCNDNLPNSNLAFIRPDMASFVSRSNSEPGNPATRTTFFLISEPISLPSNVTANTILAKKSQLSQRKAIEKYFAYRVKADDL